MELTHLLGIIFVIVGIIATYIIKPIKKEFKIIDL